MNSYEITNLLTGDLIDSERWNSIPPLRINHFLWERNSYHPEVQIRLYYNSEKLYVNFRTFETNPKIKYFQMNDPVYKDSCVEFFIQPLPQSDSRYLNFEINAAGTLLLGLGEEVNRVYLFDEDPSLFDIQATADCIDPIKNQKYWELQYSIPFSFIQKHFPEFHPTSGINFRGNFFKCGDDTPMPHFGCWNLVQSSTPNFHLKDSFGSLTLK